MLQNDIMDLRVVFSGTCYNPDFVSSCRCIKLSTFVDPVRLSLYRYLGEVKRGNVGKFAPEIERLRGIYR